MVLQFKHEPLAWATGQPDLTYDNKLDWLIDWFNLIDCLIFCDGASSLTDYCCTWYEAHFRNGLRISVLDEDLSPAQLAQLQEFLDFDNDEDLF